METARDQHIVTTGEGRVQVVADQAQLSIALSSRNPDRSLAVRCVSEESARLRAALDQVGYDHLATGGLTIIAERKIEKGVWYGLGRVVAYVVRQSFEISERRVDRVRELARLLGEWEPAAEVVVESWQVIWHLSAERHSAAVSDAAAIAYRDAPRRAAALAASMDDYLDWLESVEIRTFPDGDYHAWIPLRLRVYSDGRGALAASSSYPWPVATPAEAATVLLDLWTRGRQAAAEARRRRTA